MKPHSEQKFIDQQKFSFGSADASSGAVQYLSYDRILRSLGSMLEQKSLTEFELQLSDDVYTVRGRPSRRLSRGLSLLGRIFGSGGTLRNGRQPDVIE